MTKVPASVQHVSIFRIGSVYLFGVLYDFESDNQVGSLHIIIQGNNASFSIDEAMEPRINRTAVFTSSVNILSESSSIPFFNVRKTSEVVISVPVFSLKRHDQIKLAYELTGFFANLRQSVSVSPNDNSEIPPDIASELGIERAAAVARDWGWRGW